MFAYSLWMTCVRLDTSCQRLCTMVNTAISTISKHCHVYSSTLLDFLSGKVRFLHTSTVIRLPSRSDKNYAHASGASYMCNGV